MKSLFIKAEANEQIGGGHLYRSLALASKIRNRGAEVKFIFSETSEDLQKKVLSAGFEIIQIKKEQELNPELYLHFIPAQALVLFDTDNSQFHSGRLIDVLKNRNIKTACFTITDQHEINTDVLINPNIIAALHQYKTPKETIKCLGPSYMLLRDEFNDIKPVPKNRTFPLKCLLMFGNADTYHLTLYFLKIMLCLPEYIKKLMVVCGNLNSDVDAIKEIIKQADSDNIELYIDSSDMVSLYSRTDLAVTSAGMAMWEMALFNIPQLVFPSAEREVFYTEYLHQLKYIYNIGSKPGLISHEAMMIKLKSLFETEVLAGLKLNAFRELINPRGMEKLAGVLYQKMSLN